jgi:hypothetical protein
LIALSAFSVPHAALAQDDGDKERCVAQHADSQKARRAGKLIEARRLLLACAEPACPAPIRTECSEWGVEVGASIPSILVEVYDRRHERTSDVHVSVDGKSVLEKIAGLPVEIDPGDHEVEARLRNGETKRITLHVGLGERATPVRFDFGVTPPARVEKKAVVEPASKGIPVVTLVLGAVGLAALGTGTYFGLKARGQADDLEVCRPNCARSDAEKMRRNALLADVSFGVAFVALGVGSAVWISASSGAERSAALGWRGNL